MTLHRNIGRAASLLAALALAACGDPATEAGGDDASATDTVPAAPDAAAPTTAAPDGEAPEDDAPQDDADDPEEGTFVTASGVTVIDEPTPEPPAPGDERPIPVVRSFQCTPEGVGAQLVVAPVQGAPGDAIAIRPTDAASCQYALVYARADGAVDVLSGDTGSGWLFAGARRMGGGTTVVCANDVSHSADAGAGERHVDAVGIACALHRGGVWSPLTPVVTPDGAWAAWLRDVQPHPQRADAVVVRWARDFSFQFMNMSDAGRPVEDGVYETVVSLAGTTPEADGAPTFVDAHQNPLAGAEVTDWAPTDGEKAQMEEFIDFSDGPCANGCPTP